MNCQILSSNTYGYDCETEYITPFDPIKPFKKLHELSDNETILSLTDDNAIYFDTVIGTNFQEKYNDLMILIGTNDSTKYEINKPQEILCTPNCNILRYFSQMNTLQKIEARYSLNFKYPLEIPIRVLNVNDDYCISDSDRRLCDIILCDGCRRTSGHGKYHTLAIYKSILNPIENEIIECELKKSGTAYNKMIRETFIRDHSIRTYIYTISLKCAKKFYNLLNYNSREKTLPQWMYTLLSYKQALDSVKIRSMFDGKSGKSTTYMQCDTSLIADQVQIMSLLAGTCTRQHYIFFSNTYNPTLYVVYPNRKKSVSFTKREYFLYDGYIGCPILSSGNKKILIRRNSYIFPTYTK